MEGEEIGGELGEEIEEASLMSSAPRDGDYAFVFLYVSKFVSLQQLEATCEHIHIANHSCHLYAQLFLSQNCARIYFSP